MEASRSEGNRLEKTNAARRQELINKELALLAFENMAEKTHKAREKELDEMTKRKEKESEERIRLKVEEIRPQLLQEAKQAYVKAKAEDEARVRREIEERIHPSSATRIQPPYI